MSEAVAKSEKTNKLGFERKAYEGATSTLCGGCGHDSVTRALITAFYEAGVEPTQVAKMSGIGCSSKTTAYFLSQSLGFNGVHGRMPSMASGVNAVNHRLKVVGVSGDGDTASIGIGQFVHAIRRNTEMLYVIENNGVYGLTKGQFSATADQGAVSKSSHGKNPFRTIDCCGLAIELGAGFVARAYAANQKQMVAVFKAAMAYRGFALVDVVSPCVTFNPDLPGATKTYAWGKEHEVILNEIGFMDDGEELPEVEAGPGQSVPIHLHDGTEIRLTTVEEGYDPTDRAKALARIEKGIEEHSMLTGILLLDPTKPTVIDALNPIDEPLTLLPEKRIRPSKKVLEGIMDSYR